MAGVPILSNVETAMADLIKSMSIASGYNFDWNTVNEIDNAIGSFPRAIIDNPIDQSATHREANVDSFSGQHACAYTNETIFTIIIKGELPQVPVENSYFAIRDILRRGLDDLKQLFGRNSTISDTCDNVMYRDAQIIYIQRNDILRPAELKTSWLVIYSQDRLNPEQYASS